MTSKFITNYVTLSYDPEEAKEKGFSLYFSNEGYLLPTTGCSTPEYGEVVYTRGTDVVRRSHTKAHLGHFGADVDADALVDEIKKMSVSDTLVVPPKQKTAERGNEENKAGKFERRKALAAVYYREMARATAAAHGVPWMRPEDSEPFRPVQFAYYSKNMAKDRGFFVVQTLDNEYKLASFCDTRPHLVECGLPLFEQYDNAVTYQGPIKLFVLESHDKTDDPETVLREFIQLRQVYRSTDALAQAIEAHAPEKEKGKKKGASIKIVPPEDESTAPTQIQRFCSACHKVGVVLKCSRCKNAWYCDSTCQKKDWPHHKKTCAPV